MKNSNLYSAITFFILLIAAIFMGLKNKEFGVMGVVLVSVGWTTTRIVKEGFSSLIILTSQDDDDTDT